MEHRLKRYRGKWCVVWTERGQTRRSSLRTDDRQVAEQRFADWQIASRRPAATADEIMTAYLADKDQTAAVPQRLHDAWKALKPHFGGLRPDQIDRDVCRDYTTKRQMKGRAPGTIAKELRTLRAGLRWHDKNTPAIIEVPAADDPVNRYLTRDEYNRLLEGCATPHVRLFCILAIGTAARSGAILDLKWDRVDFEKGVIRLADGSQRRKGRATVPMNQKVRDALLRAAEGRQTDYVIEYGGERVLKIRKAFQRACDRAGLEGVTPHVLRHTAAVWMAEGGIPMSEIAQYLGHSDSRTTERVYARYSPGHLQDAADLLA